MLGALSTSTPRARPFREPAPGPARRAPGRAPAPRGVTSSLLVLSARGPARSTNSGSTRPSARLEAALGDSPRPCQPSVYELPAGASAGRRVRLPPPELPGFSKARPPRGRGTSLASASVFLWTGYELNRFNRTAAPAGARAQLLPTRRRSHRSRHG